ncbi:hypothetical protein LTR08_000035 [Meristemomyces frigidus]|nr:hypothetical protein LTR08_000035 [Meristemomyces frigidus]
MAGDLVWTSDEFGHAANSKVQRYHQQDYLTFWAGEKLTESGQGVYYMLDSAYNVVRTVSAVGDGLYGDLHEFVITDDATALISVYNRTHMDLTPTERTLVKDGYIIDGIFQEVDIASGELVFQWRASDHLGYLMSYGGYVDNGPFDYFHINSIDKDSHGNYLISLRHLHMIAYVKGSTGDVLWTLGGIADDFQDISGGAATNFKWQHDVRWVSEQQGIISLFDNGVARHHYSDATHSEGRIIQLDFTKRTAELLRSFSSPQHIRSASQGSVQILPVTETNADAHVFVGWGSSAAYSEFTGAGELLCETHFAASSLFYFERVKSYRAIKAPATWTAEPESWDPSAQIQAERLYVSWNGATEVVWWTLQRRTVTPQRSKREVPEETDFVDVEVIAKDGFESFFDISALDHTYATYRIAALDEDMDVLRYSNVVVPAHTNSRTYIIAAILFASVSILVAFSVIKYHDVLHTALVNAALTGGSNRYRKLRGSSG